MQLFHHGITECFGRMSNICALNGVTFQNKKYPPFIVQFCTVYTSNRIFHTKYLQSRKHAYSVTEKGEEKSYCPLLAPLQNYIEFIDGLPVLL